MTETSAPVKEGKAARPHRILVPVLILLGALCILISTISVWIRDAALDTENWVDQSGQLLESEDVRDVLSLYIVDQAYSAADVQARVEAALPEQFKPLAGPASSQLQAAAYEAASQALAQPRVQELWRTANEAVHGQLIAFVEGESERVQLQGDTVVLNLDQIVANVAGRIGAGEEAVASVQERVEPVVIIQADELETVQAVVRVIKALSFWPFILGLALWAGAVYLARGRRRETIRALALSLILIGIVLLAVRRIVGNRVIDSLVEAESVRAAAQDVWAIFSSLLAESAVAGVVVGIVALLAVWLAGPSRRATAVRHWLAPTFRDRAALVHGILAAVILLLLVWGPLGTPRRLLSLVILTALAFAGLEVLRRQTVREFPDAVRGDAMSLRAAFAGGSSGASVPAADTKVDRLERLAALHERGALTDEEYQAEKTLLLT